LDQKPQLVVEAEEAVRLVLVAVEAVRLVLVVEEAEEAEAAQDHP
jgi:hypothetical protein